MKGVERVLGRIILVFAAALILFGVLCWPPGGLLFALPYVFLIPGCILVPIGGLLLWRGSRARARAPSESEKP